MNSDQIDMMSKEELRQELRKVLKQLSAAKQCLTPRLWSSEIDFKWHRAIPDINKAFESLRVWAGL